MGKSVFVCEVADKAAMKAAVEAVLRHNAAPVEPLGHDYTDDEFAVLDPLRARTLQALAAQGLDVSGGCKAAFTRGEDINVDSAVLVRFRKKLWLEVVNGGGGACTTKWLQANSAAVGWHGTSGKPDGFMHAPTASPHSNLVLLLRDFDSFA